jgi:hypothetical protein
MYIILSPPHNKKRPQAQPVVLNVRLYLAKGTLDQADTNIIMPAKTQPEEGSTLY